MMTTSNGPALPLRSRNRKKSLTSFLPPHSLTLYNDGQTPPSHAHSPAERSKKGESLQIGKMARALHTPGETNPPAKDM